jgi:hypothetical protein
MSVYDIYEKIKKPVPRKRDEFNKHVVPPKFSQPEKTEVTLYQ